MTAPAPTPPILAISTGAHRGVHILKSFPLPPADQYRHRYPLRVCDTFPPLPADGTHAARFAALQPALDWLRDRDADEHLLAQLAAVRLHPPRTHRAVRMKRPPQDREVRKRVRAGGRRGVEKAVVVRRERWGWERRGVVLRGGEAQSEPEDDGPLEVDPACLEAGAE